MYRYFARRRLMSATISSKRGSRRSVRGPLVPKGKNEVKSNRMDHKLSDKAKTKVIQGYRKMIALRFALFQATGYLFTVR